MASRAATGYFQDLKTKPIVSLDFSEIHAGIWRFIRCPVDAPPRVDPLNQGLLVMGIRYGHRPMYLNELRQSFNYKFGSKNRIWNKVKLALIFAEALMYTSSS